jgi:hypothetical protein
MSDATGNPTTGCDRITAGRYIGHQAHQSWQSVKLVRSQQH